MGLGVFPESSFPQTVLLQVRQDRNRPAAATSVQASEGFAAMRDAVRGFVAAGLPPARVAEMVHEAIRDERFYVLTHPDFMPVVRHRMEGILEGRNPTFGGFGS